MLRYHFEQITSYEDAKNALHTYHCIRFFPNEADMKKANIDEASRAFIKLQIIVRALNDGWVPDNATGNVGYRPQFYLFEKISDLPVMKIECKYRYDEGKQLAFTSVTRATPESGKAYNPTCLAVRTPEIARHLGTHFIGLFAKFFYGVRC